MSSLFSAAPTVRSLLRTAVVGSAAAALVLGSAAVASAAPGISDTDDTQANVIVQSAITLTGLTPSFTLTGIPGATVEGLGIVDYTVETNNFAGYTVTVLADDNELLPTRPTNTDTIPIAALAVQETGTTPNAYTALSDVTARTVHTQGTRSAPGGDSLSSDYRVVIPFVNEDTYSVDLTYVATTL